MQWFNPDRPLWLPEGTVRALIILVLTLTTAVILLKFAAFKEEIPQSVEKIISELLPALVLLIKDYISTRSKNGNGIVPPAPGG